MWRNHSAESLATPEAFERDPGLVWLFYSYRRHKALKANPNQGHVALAQLAKKKPNFLTLTQNVDGKFTLLKTQKIRPTYPSLNTYGFFKG